MFHRLRLEHITNTPLTKSDLPRSPNCQNLAAYNLRLQITDHPDNDVPLETMTPNQESSLERLMLERAARFNTSRETVERAVAAFWLGEGATLKARNDDAIARNAGCTMLEDFLRSFAAHG